MGFFSGMYTQLWGNSVGVKFPDRKYSILCGISFEEGKKNEKSFVE